MHDGEEMHTINALSLAPEVNDWLAKSRHPHVLHVFDHACNLVNEHREVLSIVRPQTGHGPFNLVIESEVIFSRYLNVQSAISIHTDQLRLGDLTIHTAHAKLWSPCPNWEMLHTRKEIIIDRLTQLSITQSPASGTDRSLAWSPQPYSTTSLLVKRPIFHSLLSALVSADLPSSINAIQKLAGLGIGLTPAGDDFILGAVLAAWIIHPYEVAKVLAEESTNTAAALTTSLSAAWLRSAGRGAAGILWHQLFEVLVSGNKVNIQEAMDNILAVGETSGADAMAGFIGAFVCLQELTKSEID